MAVYISRRNKVEGQMIQMMYPQYTDDDAAWNVEIMYKNRF